MTAMSLSPVMFRSLWNYRGFVLGAVKREFQTRYTGALLDAVWAVLNPLAMIAVFTLIFSQVMGNRLPDNRGGTFGYSVFLCGALLPWNWFAELLGRLNTVFIDNGNLMKKASFPRLCLPTIVVLSTAVHFAIVFALFLAFLALTGNLPGWPLLAFPLVLAVHVALALGLGLLLGTLNVFFRDIGQFTSVLLQFWFWLTPIIYAPSVLPQALRNVLWVNPIVPLADAYHAIFSAQAFPDWASLIYPLLLAVFLLGLGGFAFLRLSGEIVDEL
ncbi:MAG: ABC transporter permease [Rudaea sp.]|uniref:ABC transporter permease n=1 Tax=Rudaea sp. TaxID=2136325 RepID=UPI0039E2BE0B